MVSPEPSDEPPTRNNKFLKRFGSNVAMPFWIGGNLYLMSTIGFGGTWNEMTAGFINLPATFLGAGAFGHKRYGMPIVAAVSAVGMTFQQFPHLLAGDALAWAGYILLGFSAAPVILEPWFQSGAEVALVARKNEKHTILERMKTIVLNALANSRLTYSIGGSICLMPFIIHDAMHGHYQTLPAYFSWLTGNALNAFAKAPPQAQRQLKL